VRQGPGDALVAGSVYGIPQGEWKKDKLVSAQYLDGMWKGF